MAFPLFKLPILAIKLVFEVMGFIDIFVLTNASSKTMRIVKNLLTIKNHKIEIFMGQEWFFFSFQRNSNPNFVEQVHSESGKPQTKNVFYLKIGTIEHVPSEFSPARDGAIVLTIYWSPNISAAIYNTLVELFKTPLQLIKMNLNGVAADTHKNWINWINQTSLDPSFMVVLGKCSFPEYAWILENIRAKKYLALRAELTDFDEDHIVSSFDFFFEAERIIITDGRWLEMDYLEYIESQEITIYRVCFPDSVINKFLKKWKNSEEAENLKKLTILFEYESSDPMVILGGMDVVNEDLMKPDNALKQWSFRMKNGDKCTVEYAEYDGREFGLEFRVENYKD